MATAHTTPNHETTDTPIPPILVAGGLLAVMVALSGLVVFVLFHFLLAHGPQSLAPRVIPPEPRVEEHPELQLRELRQSEDKVLSTYGWVDKKTGIVRIPIDRAMELQLQRGFPVRKDVGKETPKP